MGDCFPTPSIHSGDSGGSDGMIVRVWLVRPGRKEGQYEYVEMRTECLKAGKCGYGEGCGWGRKWITGWLVIVGKEMMLTDRDEGEDEEMEVPWSVYGDDSDWGVSVLLLVSA